ncbi:MAG: hypothetical protein LBQ68_10125 [Clostridiales bacterium]|nr:hypothetical protein [Clostridiales bacterium]
MRVILISGKARHGKSTMARYLEDGITKIGKRVMRLAFADYVKFVSAKYFGWNGEKDQKGRHILQYVGTDLVRSRDENFWVDNIIRFSKIIERDMDYVLIDDWRFPNEYTRWIEQGFENVTKLRVVRTGYDSILTPEQQLHPSETALDNYNFDYTITTSTLAELQSECVRLLSPDGNKTILCGVGTTINTV